MDFKTFLQQAKAAFYQMVINAVGSTTFWFALVLTIVALFSGSEVVWAQVLAMLGIGGYAVNRTARTIQTAGK